MGKTRLSNSILIQNAQIVAEHELLLGNLYCRNGKIEWFGPGSSFPEKYSLDSSAEVIDADGLIVFPGGIDPHVHFNLDIGGGVFSADSFLSGSEAALAGGTTTVFDFVTPARGESLLRALDQRIDETAGSLVHCYLHMSITEWNNQTAAEMAICVNERGIRSFKVYMAYKDKIGLGDGDIMKVMETAAKLDAIVMVHCEMGDAIEELKRILSSESKRDVRYHPVSRPSGLEAAAVKRVLELSEKSGCRVYIVHLSSKSGLSAVSDARHKHIYVETCPHYLIFDESRYLLPDYDKASSYVMSPPLRSTVDREALWQGIEDHRIDVIATDHCPFKKEDRQEYRDDFFYKIPNGAGGVEERIGLVYTHGVRTGRVDMRRFVELIATNPAKIFGLFPNKGVIRRGADADLVIWDPAYSRKISAATHRQASDINIYEGFETVGKVKTVIIGNRIIRI